MEENVGASGDGDNRTQVQTNKKKKAPGIEWQYAINIGDRFIDWECKLCHATKSGGAPRLREHFLGGPRKKGRTCTHPSATAVAKRLREEIQKKEAKKHYISFDNVSRMPEQHGSNNQTPEASPACTPNPVFNAQPENNPPSASSSRRPFDLGKMSMRQTSLQESLRNGLLDDAQLALAEAIYFSGNAMVMVESTHWKRAWKKIGEFGPGFSPPTYHAMRNDLLQKCYIQVKERVQRVILNNIELSGCSIVSDGWSNVQRKPLINLMIVSPRGETFVRAVDSAGMIKSGIYIADVISSVIEEVGAKNVVQIVMDNAKNCKNASEILTRRYPHVFSSGCNTHSLNLILKDWYKSDDTTWFATIVDMVRQLVRFILKRQRVLDIFRPRMSVMLKLPAETRFCTHFYTFESLLRNKDAVIHTFTCMEFHDWESTQSGKVREKIKVLKTTLQKKNWWNGVMDAYHVMMPVMYAIRNLDQRSPTLGKVWMQWWTVQRSLECPEKLEHSVVEKHWRIPFKSRQRKVLLKYFHARWIGAHTPLHSAAYMLDPEYWNMDLMSNVEVVHDFYKVVNTFYDNVDDRVRCIKEMTSFRLKEGLFSNSLVQQMAKEQPAWKWWMMNGGEHYALLRGLAMKVLSQCSSNSGSERNWSMYKYIHSTTRNRLLADRADKLVYMYCNEKILRHIESEEYEEDMPRWMYDCDDAVDENFDVGPVTCTSIELDDNLDVDLNELNQACDRVENKIILENDDDIEDETIV